MKDNKIKISSKLAVFLLFLSSCANIDYRVNQQKLLADLKNHNYDSAEKTINDKHFYNKEKDNFLNKVEKGTVYYLRKDYYQALKYFEKAQNICEESETVRLSGKIKGAINANSDFYYCENYERSLLNFYLSLINYNLYLLGEYEPYTKQEEKNTVNIPKKILNQSEKLAHLSASRSYIIKWNSLLSTYKKELAGKSGYKDDLVAKLWGAFIHEQFDNFENRQIALQLYKDAKTVLLKNYSVYPTFNKKNKAFEKNYKKFNNNNIDKIKRDYIENTEFSSKLLTFLDEKIKNLSLNRKDNFTIVLKENFVSEKKGKIVKVNIPLEFLNVSIDTDGIFNEKETENDEISMVDFALIALSGSDIGLPTVEFELPYIEEREIENNFIAKISDKNKKKVAEFPIVLLNPNSDIAYKELKDKSSFLYFKIKSKAISEHTAALIAAYQIYRKNPNPVGLFAALASYKAAAKLINDTTKADLRYWVSLTDNVRFGSTNLNAGEYMVDIYSVKKDGKRSKVKSEIVKIDGKNGFMLDVNL